LKRTFFTIVLFALCIFPVLTMALTPSATASPTPASFDVKVDHIVQIRNGGLITINDTIRLSPKPGETALLSNYTLGMPFGYQYNLDYTFAYETSNPNSKLRLELDASMGRIGFYGVNVIFPQATNLTAQGQYEFTLIFVFSNSVSFSPIVETYNASFPAYPSLTQNASQANLAIIFPTGFNYTASSFESQGANFIRTIRGSQQYFNYTKGFLNEFSDQAGWFAFAKSQTALELLEVKEVNREITLGGEQIAVSNSYRLVSKAEALNQIKIRLLKGASAISAHSDYGDIAPENLKIETGGASTNVTITFVIPFEAGVEARFSVQYQLPWKDYVSTQSWSDFRVSLTLFDNPDWTIRKVTAVVFLPEGATPLSSPASAKLESVQNAAFTSSLIFGFQNATPFNDLSLTFRYQRLVFWDSFRPTVWMGAVVIIVSAVVAAFQVSKPTVRAPLPTAIIGARAEDLKSFVDWYDEKRRLTRELEVLEEQARKGKIPRRRYKVRKMTIDSRLTSLSRDLAALREKIRMAGPRYADLMRQLEVAETELQGAGAEIDRAEIRYRRGELSAQAYNNVLETAYRRRDRARTTVDGVLLRLREEIS